MHPKPPILIDGAIVKFWTSGKKRPLFLMPIKEADETIEIWGLAICRYSKTGEIYRFACDYEWETQNDIDFGHDMEAAKTARSAHYDIEKIQWVTR